VTKVDILDLPGLVAALPADARRLAEGLFDISAAEGDTDPPAELTHWLIERFGSAEAVRHQRLMRVTNRWSLESTLYSPLRSRRPIAGHARDSFERLVEATRGDEFCRPQTGTPADTWGRVSGRRSLTAANAAKYDGRHGVVIFDHHDPLAFDHESVIDMLEVGHAWADRGRAEEPAASNYLLIWNCGPRAGGSIVHGHAQVLLGRDPMYAGHERLRRAAEGFGDAMGETYLSALATVHRHLDLLVAEEDGVTTFASLTPIKERELWVTGAIGMDERDVAFANAVARAVVAFRDALRVRAFNMVLLRPPLDADRSAAGGWDQLPPIVRLVDRGDPDSHTSDIGAMELYAASVVGTDPFQVAAEMRAAMPSRAIG
jgi:hypothetical protein